MPDRLTPAFRARRRVAAAAAGRGRAGPRGAALGRGAAHVLRADRQARGAGGRHRVGRQDRGEPQSADGGPVLPALLRAAVRRAARADAAVARLRRHRRSLRPDRHQQPRHRRRRPGEDFARRQARVRGRCRAQGPPRRPCGAARQGRQQGALPGDRLRQLRRTAGRRRGAGGRQSVRRRPDRDPRHRLGAWRGPRSASRIISSSSRPTPRSIPAIPAARWSTWPGASSASTPRSSRAPAARRASASPFPPPWCGWWWPRRAPAAARSSGRGSAPSSRR